MSFVLRNTKGANNGWYAAGRASRSLVDDLQQARVFTRKVDAMNSIPSRERGEWEVVKVILISPPELNGLRKDCEKLDALEAYGVDNWEGYSEAIRSLREADG